MNMEEKIDELRKEVRGLDDRVRGMENLTKQVKSIGIGILIGLIVAFLVMGIITVKEAVEVIK